MTGIKSILTTIAMAFMPAYLQPICPHLDVALLHRLSQDWFCMVRGLYRGITVSPVKKQAESITAEGTPIQEAQ